MNSNDNISKVMEKSSVIKATPIPKSHFFLKKKIPKSHGSNAVKKNKQTNKQTNKQKIKTHIHIKIIVK